MSQPGRGPATSRPSLRLLRDDRVRDIGVPPSPMPCCGCQQTAERTMTWQDSSPQPDQAWHRAHGRQGPVLAILAMLTPHQQRGSLDSSRLAVLRVAPGCCALPLTRPALRGRRMVSGQRASRQIDAKTPAAGVEQRATVRSGYSHMRTCPHIRTEAAGSKAVGVCATMA